VVRLRAGPDGANRPTAAGAPGLAVRRVCRGFGRHAVLGLRVPAGAQQRERAQRDARDDRGAAERLGRAGGVAEDHDPRDRADERLDVDERSGHLGGHPGLAVGEERERQQRAGGHEGHGGQERARAVRGGGDALGRRQRHGGERGPEELNRGDRNRVTPAQQAGLRHGERGRQQQRREHQAVAADRGTAAPAAGDHADAGERHGEPDPGHRARHRVLPERRDERHEHRDRADQQCGVGDAGAGDAGVLQEDRPAVSEGTRCQHQRRAGGAHPAGAAGRHGEQDRGGQAEADEREPARRQPLQGQLGQRHGSAPEEPGGGEGGDCAAAIDVHKSMTPAVCTEFASAATLRNYIAQDGR